MKKSHVILLHPFYDMNDTFVQRIMHTVYVTYPLITQQSSQLSDQLLKYHGACVQVTLISLNNGPKAQESGADNLDTPKRSCKVLPLGEKVCMYEYIHMYICG